MAHHAPPSYEALLAETLPMLDEAMAKSNRPIHERPFEAARFIIEQMIVEVPGDTRDNYLSKPWFAGIYVPVVRWYERRYGAALAHPGHPTANGLVLHFGALYALRVEFVLSDVDEDGHPWVRFPTEVLPGEQPVDWLVSPPQLAAVKPSRREALENISAQVASRLRSIYNDLNTASYASPAERRMATSVIRHLDKAALDAVSARPDAHSLVPWELQMACEKTMKAYLAQFTGYPETHDLRILGKLAEPKLKWVEAPKSLGRFPSAARIVKWRYGQLEPPTVSEIWRMYGAALELCHGYASRMERKIKLANFAVKLKKPPGTESLSSDA